MGMHHLVDYYPLLAARPVGSASAVLCEGNQKSQSIEL